MTFTRTGAVVLALGAIAVACTKVPVTGRRQYNLIPDAIVEGMGRSSYQSTLQKSNVQRTGKNHDTLQTVGERISRVARRADFDWSYAMIQENTVNAWCLPGGYIGFYTGILPVLKNESGMAFVMGHEVGHATARHGSERLSQHASVLGGTAALFAVVQGKTKLDAKQSAIVAGAFGIATEIGIVLPFSRMHESEADAIGLMYMAEAGYPPAQASPVWDRMNEATGGSSVPVFVSTHPSHKQRQKTIAKWLPAAQKRFRRNRLERDTTEAIW